MRASTRAFIEAAMQDAGDIDPEVVAEVEREVEAEAAAQVKDERGMTVEDGAEVADVVAALSGRAPQRDAEVAEVAARLWRTGGKVQVHRG